MYEGLNESITSLIMDFYLKIFQLEYKYSSPLASVQQEIISRAAQHLEFLSFLFLITFTLSLSLKYTWDQRPGGNLVAGGSVLCVPIGYDSSQAPHGCQCLTWATNTHMPYLHKDDPWLTYTGKKLALWKTNKVKQCLLVQQTYITGWSALWFSAGLSVIKYCWCNEYQQSDLNERAQRHDPSLHTHIHSVFVMHRCAYECVCVCVCTCHSLHCRVLWQGWWMVATQGSAYSLLPRFYGRLWTWTTQSSQTKQYKSFFFIVTAFILYEHVCMWPFLKSCINFLVEEMWFCVMVRLTGNSRAVLITSVEHHERVRAAEEVFLIQFISTELHCGTVLEE